MNAQTDQQLLRDYAERQSEAAFAELVRRHVALIYSAALRMVCDTHLAKDVTQGVFLALAQSARQLTDRPALSGWLHRTAQNIATKLVRTDVRRRAREQEAAAMNELLAAEPNAVWERIAPHLDTALGELAESDRDALLLRYFECKSAREMAQTLGISDDAAQKRVSRAVERLRGLFAKRGVTVGASGLAVLISANAVQAAPVGLALTISTVVALTGTTLATTATATKAITMTALQKTVITATMAVLAGAGIYETRQASQLRHQVQTLQQQTTVERERLSDERNKDGTKELFALRQENENLRKERAELPRLRGEVARLRRDIGELAQTAEANDPMVKKALKWKANEAMLRKLFEDRPEHRIPQMQLLSDETWLDLARDADLSSEIGIRNAFSEVRRYAENQFVMKLSDALRKFGQANEQKLPDALSQLKPYFDPPVDDAMIAQYKLLHTEKEKAILGTPWAITERALVDEDYDTRWGVGPSGYGPIPPSQQTMSALLSQLAPAIKAFTAANNGTPPSELAQLKPYVLTPELSEVAERLDRLGGFLPPLPPAERPAKGPGPAGQ